MIDRVDLIGSNGMIGKVILEYLESNGVVVRKITRGPSIKSIGFKNYIDNDKSELIIDVSLMSIQNSIKLRQSLENSKSRLIHLSSVSSLYDENQYGQYKRSIYRSLKGYKNTEIYFGDIFEHDGRILGFWKKLDRYSTRIYSFRNVHVYNIEQLCKCILIGKRYEPEMVKINFIKRSIVSICFKTRFYRILNLLGIYIIK